MECNLRIWLWEHLIFRKKFKIDLTSSTRFKKYDYTEILKSLLSESENDNYYQNVTVKKDEEKDLSYITLDVSDINKALYFKAIETGNMEVIQQQLGLKILQRIPIQ